MQSPLMADQNLVYVAQLREALRMAKQLGLYDDVAHWKAELKKLGLDE